MREEKVEGICLQETSYLEKSRILKVFTKECGLIGIIEKRSKATLTPFSLGEWIIKKGKGDLYALQDASLLDPLLHLRSSYETLMRAGKMTQDLLYSQLPEKSAPSLYLLFLSYLKRVAQFEKPAVLSASFQLKLLLHEGLFLLEPKSFPQFSLSEWEVILSLCRTPTFSELNRLIFPNDLEKKIDIFFRQVIHSSYSK
ncbi:MAG: DNA repair protein RecO [Chlamydiia bacterium]|nr:DNA repair protein RecO [Chlamydiia bacterium]